MNSCEILSSKKIKRTSCREQILDILMTSNTALSENEIREKMVENYDRTTFYRTFKTLLDKNIVHKIVVDSQLVKYASNNSFPNKTMHAHFYCFKCDSVSCVDYTPIDIQFFQTGHTFLETKVLFRGICPKCNNTNECD